MNKLIAIAVAAIVIVAAAAAIALSNNGNNDDGPNTDIEFKDALNRTITFSEAPEKVAVVNTDLAYYMDILGLNDLVVAMDTDGLAKMKEYSEDYDDVTDLGKRGALSGSTALEKMKLSGVTCVLTPTTMGIGTTVLADVIENNGITVVYLNAYGEDMLDYLDKMVIMFGGGSDITLKADTYKNTFIENKSKAQKIVEPDSSIDFACYMSSSSGSLGNYYLSSSELSGIITSVSGTNVAQASSGSFSQYTGESLYALFYDGNDPKVDYIFIRGTDGYTEDQVMTIFDDQVLYGSYTVGDYAKENNIPVIYINTHLVSGVMCYISYYIYAYAFEGTLAEHISDIDKLSQEFLQRYDLTFPNDDDHPWVDIVDY